MPMESGGADPSRGYRYQDKVAAYFFLRGLPKFHGEKLPLELHIEQDDSDFCFFIRRDDREIGHYFEVKRTGTGELKWGKFKNDILRGFIEIKKNHSRPTDVEYFHAVINTTFATKIDRAFSDSKDLRLNVHTWLGINNKSERKYLGEVREDIDYEDDNNLHDVMWGLVGYALPEEMLDDEILDYLEKCSPRNPRQNKRVILDIISDKGSGVIRRDELESELNIQLKPTDDSSSSNQKPAEIMSQLDSITDNLNSKSKKDLYIDAEDKIRGFQRSVERGGKESNVRLESESTQALSKAQELQELARKEEEKEFGLARAVDNMIDASDITASEGDDA